MLINIKAVCQNKKGIIAEIGQYIRDVDGDIVELQQFADPNGLLFLRVCFRHEGQDHGLSSLRDAFMPLVEKFGLSWSLRAAHEKRRVLLMVSKFDHCMVDLLYRWRLGELPITIAGIVSNHPKETYSTVEIGDLPFHYLPIDAASKPQQEALLWDLISREAVELVVLARYMQVLSADLISRLRGRCINVHHSFLPGFKGAKPYHQAYVRGVKLIGATAHFVTEELDEGPIIEQAVARINHHHGPEELVRKGRDVERYVLSEAVRYFIQDRIVLNGNKTIVFND